MCVYKNNSITFKNSIRSVLLAFGLICSAVVSAQDATDTIDVSATVIAAVPTCQVAVGNVDFGDIEAGDVTSLGDYDQDFNMNFQCSDAVTGATATFDGGQNVSSAGTIRRLAGPSGALISYTINEIPSVLISVGETLTFNLNSGNTSIPLRARVSTQTIPSTIGAYSDTITVTFNF